MACRPVSEAAHLHVSGDLVAELHSDDAVNADIRQPVTGDDGVIRDGTTGNRTIQRRSGSLEPDLP